MTKSEEITRNAMIHLTSSYDSVRSEEDEDSDEESETAEASELEMSTEGVIRVTDGRIEIEYFETELTGMEGSCTCVSFERDNPGIVSMIRTGSVTTALVFEEGKRHICAYNTDIMAFELCVKTSEVRNDMTELGGELELDYCIEFRGASTEHTHIRLTAAPTGV